eukprot:gb/GECG01008325.1/.p1 GENE.gb/GECG01008325.1/~~gb/GECG01008325.1/.p1  ORF type:complete len:129 (+),score=14.30 gb/GECG01008325.1/:1-387(+)
MAAKTHFKASSSNVSQSTLSTFIQKDLSDDLIDVPGIGPKGKEALENYGIRTPKQLIGQFLLLKDPDLSIQEHCDAMFHWLTDGPGVKAAKSTVVRSLGLKVSTMIPGIYDEEYVELVKREIWYYVMF